jgi:hypothetical protein
MVPNPEPSPPTAVAEISPFASVVRALWTWLWAVVVFSAVALMGPLFVPWFENSNGRFGANASFGKGELLSFCFAIFAAAVSRWIVHEGHRNVALMVISIVGMFIVASAISLLWYDTFVHGSPTLKKQVKTVQISEVLIVLSLICGAATEWVYALSLRPAFVRVRHNVVKP